MGRPGQAPGRPVSGRVFASSGVPDADAVPGTDPIHGCSSCRVGLERTRLESRATGSHVGPVAHFLGALARWRRGGCHPAGSDADAASDGLSREKHESVTSET